jgi:hypothetical protein
MTTIVTRAGKGSSLSWNEVDANFTNLNSGKLETTNNLSDITNAATARTNLGLGNVDNTSDINKPVSTVQQTAIDASITTHVGLADPHTQYLQESIAAGSTGSSLIGFTQGITGAVTRTVQAKERETISVKDFGAVGDGTTDDTAAFNLAIAYANSKGGQDRANIVGTTIFIPTGRYKITSTLTTITVSHVVFSGESRDSSVLLINTTSNVLHFGGGVSAGLIVVGGGVNNLKIEYQVTPNSSSVFLYADYAFSLQLYDLVIVQIGTLIKAGRNLTYQAGELYLDNINGTIANVGVPLIDLLYGSGFFMSRSHIFVYGVNIPTHPASMTTVAGTYVINASSGLLWDTAQIVQCIFERFDRGVYAYANSTAIYETFKFTNVIFDYFRRECVYLDSGGGGILANFKFDRTCWYLSWETDTIFVACASGVNDRHSFSGEIIISGKNGINYYNPTGTSTTFSDMVVTGCNRLAGGYSAFLFTAGSKGFRVYNIIGNHIPLTPYPNYQGTYGISVGADCDEYIITGCSFKGSTAGWNIVTNTVTSTNRKIYNNIYADYAASVAATVPASATLYQNKTPFIEEYSFYGGTSTVYNKNGFQIGTVGPCTFTLQPSEYYYITYTVVPTGLKTIQR